MRNSAVEAWLVALWAVTIGCGPASSTSLTRTKPTPVPQRAMTLVTSSIVIDQCPAAKQVDRKRASKEIEAMVAPCRSIPGGSAHFSATLLPDGRVQLGSPSGDPATGIIPTCLLQEKTPLRHSLRLQSSCKFDVQLEETGNASKP